MRWPWQKRIPPPAPVAAYNPIIDHLDGFTPWTVDGVPVNADTALTLSAFFRAVTLISQTLASLPLRSYRQAGDGIPVRTTSVFDDPDPGGQTPFEWKETLFLHMLLHGHAGALKRSNGGGALAALPLCPPSTFTVEVPTPADRQAGRWPVGGLWFHVRLDDGTHKKMDATEFWYVPGMSLDGKTGVSLLHYARASMATTISGDRAARKVFTRGALISGIATPEYDDGTDITEDVPEIRRQIAAATSGADNAGTIAVINRRLKVQPWSMSATDAQFLQSRQFQIEEISRWTGVPPHLLMQTEKQTSWGTGVDEQNRALGRTVLSPWAQRLEGRGSRLLANPRWVELEFAGLERPSPDREIELLIQQVQAGLLTVNEARKVRNLPPLPDDVSRETVPADQDQEGDEDDPPTA
jgi:HK97 family phage portal protein